MCHVGAATFSWYATQRVVWIRCGFCRTLKDLLEYIHTRSSPPAIGLAHLTSLPSTQLFPILSWKDRLFVQRCWWHLTLHIINVDKNVSRLFYVFLPYLCLHTVGLDRMEVAWVCFDVLFFISEYHFLFLLIFILFWLACIYLCCWCFP